MPLDDQGIYFPENDPYREAYLSLPMLYDTSRDPNAPIMPLPALGENASEGDRALYARLEQLYNAKRDYPNQIAAQGLDYAVSPSGYDNPDEGGYGDFSRLLNDIAYGPLHPGTVQYNDPNIQNFVAGTLGNAQRTDSFSFLGDQFFPAVALLGAAVGGAALAGGFPGAGAAGAGAAGAGAGEVGAAAGLGNLYGVELGAGGALAAGGGGASGLIAPAVGPGLGAAGAAGAAGTAAGAAGGAGAAGAAGTAAGAAGPVGTLGTLGTVAGIAGPAINGITGLVGAINSGNAARDAAEIQANAARDANQLLRDIYTQNRADLGPYREAGYQALGTLQGLAGQAQVPYSPTPALDANQYAFQGAQAMDPSSLAFAPRDALDAAAYQFQPTAPVDYTQHTFTPPTVTDDPGYKFRLEQGQKALERNLAAQGKYLSGAALKELTEYGQGMASQEYGAAYQRALAQNQLQYGRAQDYNQQLYDRGLTANQLLYNRALTQNQDQYGRDLTANQLLYDRSHAYNQELYQRGLTGNQLAYERALAQNQLQQQRGLDAYNAEAANRNRQFSQVGTLAGLGLGAATNTANLAAQSGAAQGENLLGAANANAAGTIGSATAFNQGLSSIGNAAQQYLNYLLLTQGR